MDEMRVIMKIRAIANDWYENRKPSALPDELPPRPPQETPPAHLVDSKRLDRIWKYLQAFIPRDLYAELTAWAAENFGYTYYIVGQKYPTDLRTQVCDKLRSFTEEQIAELEKLLEAKE